MVYYDYQCKKCGYEGEYKHPMEAKVRFDCPRCAKKGETSRLVKKVSCSNISTSKTRARRIVVQDLPCGFKSVQRTDSDSFTQGIITPCGAANFTIGSNCNPLDKFPDVARDISEACRKSQS